MAKNLSVEQMVNFVMLGEDAQKLYNAGLKNVGVDVREDGDPVLMTGVIPPNERLDVCIKLGRQTS